MRLLNFILENAPAHIVQEAVREFDIKGIGYKMRMTIINEFPEYRNSPLQFGIDLSNEFKEFQAETIILIDLNNKITQLQNKIRIYSRWHDEYKGMCQEHDLMVELNNRLNEPINKFLKLYKKAQRNKGKRLSVVQKKQRHMAKPAL